MNIHKACIGALVGLKPTIYDPHIRKLQVSFAIHLAKMEKRGDIQDGDRVTNRDLCMLKERGEVRLK